MPAAVSASLRAALLPVVLVLTAAVSAACGEQIGDECTLSSDCSPEGDRICDITSPGGYCTIFGCDYDSCPEESVCIRFFSVADSDRTCDVATEDRTEDACTADELCTLGGTCVPRTAEVRYCMKTCESAGECREGYECRTEQLMREHGGEPVPPPGETLGANPQPFCASTPL